MLSFGVGVGTKNTRGEWIEVYYPAPRFQPEKSLVEAACTALDHNKDNAPAGLTSHQCSMLSESFKQSGHLDQAELVEKLKITEKSLVVMIIDTDQAPKTVPEVYLKLHLLSHRLVQPNELNLSGMFELLHNVAWTSDGPIDIEDLPRRILHSRLQGRYLSVDSVDKFPKMTDYVVPAGVRIGDSSRVRLGAYLGIGTTVMPEGFVNFNAGALGPGMIEGRVSSGVMVGKDSDLGGGCSTMGTLSGGGDVVITVGESCLIGANAGVGISLGDYCTVEAGLYVTAGAKVNVIDDKGDVVQTVTARQLSGQSDLLFRRNSQSGCVECLKNEKPITLNDEAHAYN